VALVADFDHLVFGDEFARDSAQAERGIPCPGCDHLGLALECDGERLENECGRTARFKQIFFRSERDGYVS
jgi:hypothetical protein